MLLCLSIYVFPATLQSTWMQGWYLIFLCISSIIAQHPAHKKVNCVLTTHCIPALHQAFYTLPHWVPTTTQWTMYCYPFFTNKETEIKQLTLLGSSSLVSGRILIRTWVSCTPMSVSTSCTSGEKHHMKCETGHMEPHATQALGWRLWSLCKGLERVSGPPGSLVLSLINCDLSLPRLSLGLTFFPTYQISHLILILKTF